MPPPGESPRRPVASAGLGAGLVGQSAGLVGLILTFILVNALGWLAFGGHPGYSQAQGLGSLFFFLAIPAAPLGALYWVAVTRLVREPRSPRRRALPARQSDNRPWVDRSGAGIHELG